MLSYVGRDVPSVLVIGAPAGPGKQWPVTEVDIAGQLNATANYSAVSLNG
ncbi:hypothetical protein ACFO7V_05740 [Glutamicibacter bergerei]|uniref:Uncharacterized protein n=1 Tax=Glutamicibacter bergerei TaxID=256702 RepID=A0ABV9MKG3_9MICC